MPYLFKPRHTMAVVAYVLCIVQGIWGGVPVPVSGKPAATAKVFARFFRKTRPKHLFCALPNGKWQKGFRLGNLPFAERFQRVPCKDLTRGKRHKGFPFSYLPRGKWHKGFPFTYLTYGKSMKGAVFRWFLTQKCPLSLFSSF